jgi:hypothetical protein
VTPTTPVLSDFLVQGFNLGLFCRARFLSSYEIQLGIPNDHVPEVASNKTLVKVSITAPIIRASVQV